MVLRLGTAAAGLQQTDKIVFLIDAPAANGASPCTGWGTGEVFAPWFLTKRCIVVSRNKLLRGILACFFFFFVCFGEPVVHFRNFHLCCPSQRSARSQVPSEVATHQEIGSQLWAGETPDSNPGLQDNSLTRYH
jgi:hypothetical protein